MYTGAREANPVRILVVRLGAMGDIIHSLPGAASLKHSFPDARVSWVVEPKWVPLLERNGFVDRIVVVGDPPPKNHPGYAKFAGAAA